MKITKILSVLSLLVFGLAVAPSVHAARTVNRDTGYQSNNRTVVRETKNTTQSSFRLGAAINVDLVGESTGGNQVNGNTTGENKVVAGDANGTILTDDYVNFSTLDVEQGDPVEESSAVNDKTGAQSTNVAKVKRTSRVSTSEVAIGGVLNVGLAHLETGDNSVSGNTAGPNSVTTGDATTKITHNSDVNSSVVTIKQ